MTVHLNCDHRIAGTVKFDSTVPLDKLVEIIRELKSHGDPTRWVDLHIRGAGDDGSRFLAFHYILEDGSEKVAKKAGHRLIGYLRDKLGTRPGRKDVPNGVMGWSMSNVKVVA